MINFPTFIQVPVDSTSFLSNYILEQFVHLQVLWNFTTYFRVRSIVLSFLQKKMKIFIYHECIWLLFLLFCLFQRQYFLENKSFFQKIFSIKLYYFPIFGRVDFREDGKKMRKWWWGPGGECLVGLDEDRRKWWWGLGVFFLGPSKSFLIKMGRKLGGGNFDGWMTKMPMCKLNIGFNALLLLFFFFLLS